MLNAVAVFPAWKEPLRGCPRRIRIRSDAGLDGLQDAVVAQGTLPESVMEKLDLVDRIGAGE